MVGAERVKERASRPRRATILEGGGGGGSEGGLFSDRHVGIIHFQQGVSGYVLLMCLVSGVACR